MNPFPESLTQYQKEKIRQFEKFSNRLQKLIQNKSYWVLSHKKRQEYLKRIQRFYTQVSGLIPEWKLKQVLGVAAAVVFSFQAETVTAQSFAPAVLDTFGLTPNPYSISAPTFADIDADGDLDAFVGSYVTQIYYYQNVGTATSPAFAVPSVNPFGLADSSYRYFSALAFVDIDADGDLDVFVGGVDYSNIQYYENVGDSSAPSFSPPIFNPFGLPASGIYGFSFADPDFVDLDADGDFDLMTGQYGGNFIYFENAGSDTAAAFSPYALNPFGLDTVQAFAGISFGDLDFDGDQDLLVSEYYGALKYFENTGDSSSPAFAAQVVNPFGLDTTGILGFPDLVDIDNDGDLDCFVGTYNYGFTNIHYFENMSIAAGSQAILPNITLNIYPNPASDQIILEFNSNKRALVQFYDAMGKLVKKRDSVAANQPISVAGLSPGMYFVRAKVGGKVLTERLLMH